MAEYSVHSPFDLEKHKETFTNYLEVLIDEEGTIMYAVPSHQQKGIALACTRLGVSRDTLDAMIPQKYWCNVLEWLCMAAKVVFVWNDGCVYVNPTTKQIGALRRLKMDGVYTGPIPQTEKGDNHD